MNINILLYFFIIIYSRGINSSSMKNNKNPQMCLNMIVKDEAHIIEDTLTKLLKKIKIDYWVISDTGSTDNTKSVITTFFKKNNIKGEMYDDKWKDFGYNRTAALAHAYNKSKYVLIFDADDELCGDFVLPKEMNKDAYYLQFGDANGTSYIRTQIVNNHKKWKYVGVLHEYIACMEESNGIEVITGNYYTVSGRTSSRNKAGDKYMKDALILEKAYEEALQNKDEIYNRYGFYCANSYYDAGKYEEAIKWFKITINNKNWDQEKYMSCLKAYHSYKNIGKQEEGFYYLVNAFKYDKERVECLYELVHHYCATGQNEVAYGYFSIVKSFYNEKYVNSNITDKLFVDVSKGNLFLPYYMIIVADKVGDRDTGIKMYKIIFTKKHQEKSTFFIGNMLYNLQFFIEHAKDDQEFLNLFKEYIKFLLSIRYDVYDHEFMTKYEKYGIEIPQNEEYKFSKNDCSVSNKILLYVGYSPCKWNYTYSLTNALGGSETAALCLARKFPQSYEVYIAGDLEEEKVDNITFINMDSLKTIVKDTAFYMTVVSRYLNFFDFYRRYYSYKTFIWGHDIALYSYGTNMSPEQILTKWANKITGCVCQTEWHKNQFITLYPMLKNKIHIINNGIDVELFDKNIHPNSDKIPNRFVYSSCSERGLDRLLELWPRILEKKPDAELYISSYNNFPKNSSEEKMKETIGKYSDSIKHLGKLTKPQLYSLMMTSEYWLYPTCFNETSCITAMELLMSEVICLYYPIAGLIHTMGDYGIRVERGNEIDAIVNLTTEKKNEMKANGKEYASLCSWTNRSIEWQQVFESNNERITEKIIENIEDNIEDNTTYPSYPIHIINLKKREDRRQQIESKMKRAGINSYNFFEAVNGKELEPTPELFSLFERNDFYNKKGVIGCALSHIHLWNKLINDKENDFYIIFEDDINLCPNFNKHLDSACKLFIEQKLEHLALGEYHSKKIFPSFGCNLEVYPKDLYTEWNTFFAYIIGKGAAKKSIEYINSCSIKCAIDNPQAFGYILKYSSLNVKLVHCEIVNEYGSDIQTSNGNDSFNYAIYREDDIREITVSFCDWWVNEYFGGAFDKKNNFFTNVLREYGDRYNVKVVDPSENPDILFYSIFGSSHKNYKAERKIFFSGEPCSHRYEADFNITFDYNSYKNTRVPLWAYYCSKEDIKLFMDRKYNNSDDSNKEKKFCSFIATGPGLANNRKEFVEKLSKYKKVDCGGSFLNNIEYNVPMGINCSGKIEHNNNYKFAMAFESKSYPGYVTEKIYDIFKSHCVPIYWGHKDVVKDFNPKSFINANDFSDFDELIEYIKKVDNDDDMYSQFFKQTVLSDMWIDIFNDSNKCFFKNVADKIIGGKSNLYKNYSKSQGYMSKKTVNIFNIWHNKLFDNCYKSLDEYSLDKINMYDVNQNYTKIYNKDKNYKIVKEYELDIYNNVLQATNYCQTSCLYHVFVNGKLAKNQTFYHDNDYIGFIQYDMELESNFIYDIEDKINSTDEDEDHDVFFYSLVANDKLCRHLVCNPYENSILEKYNNYFNTNHTYDSIISHNKSKYFICLHTFVIPTTIYMKMMKWYCSISDSLHVNYVNGVYTESMSEVTEEVFGLFLLLQIIENDNIKLEELKLKHDWPHLHNETSFNNYKDNGHYFPLSSIVNNNLTDKNSYHSYLDVYEELFKKKQLTSKNVLEIGIERGGSLKLWSDYFVNAKIYGLDINDAPLFLSEYERIITKKCNAYCSETLNYFIEQNIKFDVIVDDGPHTLKSMSYVINNYTQLLNKYGIIVIEDVQNIDWCQILHKEVPHNLKQFSYYIDRRHIKGTLDDILFIIENKEQEEEDNVNKDENKDENKDVNNDVNNDENLWIMYAFNGHNFKVIEDYINSLNEALDQTYKIVYTQNVDFVLSCNPKKVSYIMNIADERILNKYKNTNVELSFLNTEPLSISYNLDLLKSLIYKYPYVKIYDYSFSNLQIIKHHNLYGELLEYRFYEKENIILKELNSSEPKVYDFGIITYGNTETNTIECLIHKKKDVVECLISKGFKIHIISGWGIERDKELAKCKVILNVHSILGINGQIYYSKTFENIRCNRLLDAGFKILSEDSINTNKLSAKYKDNLKFINYRDFKTIEYTDSGDIWDKIAHKDRIKKYCFIHSCNMENVGTYRLDYLIDKLNTTKCIEIFDKVYIINIGIPIENSYDEKYEIINYSHNIELYENPTINFMKDFSEKNPNSYMLYIHTKGVRYNPNDNKENDWIDYMLYFLVDQSKLCISILDNNYETVGCNYSNDLDKECFKYTHPFPPPHYNGNFWWANTNYVRTLPLLSEENPDRNAPEFWLFKNNPIFYNLHSSQVSHFLTNYPRDKYCVN